MGEPLLRVTVTLWTRFCGETKISKPTTPSILFLRLYRVYRPDFTVVRLYCILDSATAKGITAASNTTAAAFNIFFISLISFLFGFSDGQSILPMV